MNEREELKRELEQELEWVQYRQKMLDIIEGKLFEIKQLVEYVNQNTLTTEEIDAINIEIYNLAEQIKALDGESRRVEDEKILE